MRKSVLVGAAIAGLLGIAGAIRCNASDADEPDRAATVIDPARDRLKVMPWRARWAAPLCRPSGIVQHADGGPAPNALVIVRAAPIAGAPATEPITMPETRTDARGAFALPAIAAGAWIVVAALPGLRAAIQPLSVGTASDCDGLALTLGRAGHPVTGTVTDVSGGPVLGAMIVARSKLRPDEPAAIATTGTDGRYALTAAEGDFDVDVRHPDYVGVSAVLAVRGATTFDAVLTPGATVRGIVLTRDGREPVAGARVLYRGGRASGSMGGRLVEVVSDDDGRFAMTGVGTGRAWFRAIAPGHASRDSVEIELGIAEARNDVELLVEPARRIRGVVVLAGKPVARALVTRRVSGDRALEGADERDAIDSFARGWDGGLPAETDDAGVFELWGLAPAAYELNASTTGKESELEVHVDVTRSDVDNVVLELHAGFAVRGRVEPPQVATVGPNILAFDTAHSRWTAASSITTGADGRFAIAGVPPGSWLLRARTDDNLRGEGKFEITSADVDDLVIVLEPHGVTVAGRVVDRSGKPVGGVTVGETGAVTTKDGSFAIEGVEPGPISIAVTASDGPLPVTAPGATDDMIEVPAAGIADLQLTVESRDRTLHGIVVGAGGAPAADVWVVARIEEPGWEDSSDLSGGSFEWSGASRVALTGADGRFAISGLRPGPYAIEAETAHGDARGIAHVPTPDQLARIQLVGLGGLTVAASRNGSPVTRYVLEIDGPQPDYRVVASADGRIALRGMAPGTYQLRATSDDAVANLTVDVPAGRAATADMTFRAWGSVTGQVVDATTGKPLAGIYAFIDGAGVASAGPAGWISGPDGRFTVPHVAPGDGTLILYSGMGDGQRTPITVAEGGRVDVGVVRVVPPPRSSTPPDDSDPCDEVSCVLSNYDGACCAKFKH